MNRILLLLVTVFVSTASLAQTVGLLSFTDEAYDGYNLFYPHNQGSVFLIDNCGQIVRMWDDEVYKPGNSVYLSEDGLLYSCKGQGALSNEWIHAGGGGEKVEIRNMDDDVLWDWAFNDSLHRLHHDIAVMPNGNFLAIAWERKFMDEAVQAGRPADALPEGELWPEMVIEVQPIYPDSAVIVWEWHAWDHLVQDTDAKLDNFGDVTDPKLINVNFTSDSTADWHHSNAIDYNADLDQVMLSIPEFNELWIIDHSTTTSQAAGHTGGLSGHGGDLLYRWGNPAAYGQGDAADQKLFFQHDTHWIDQQLTSASADYGKIMVFNNRFGENFSSVEIIAPNWDGYEGGYVITDDVYEPTDYNWHYQRPDSAAMYSTGLSSAQRLANGNTLICVGRFGYTFEINEDEEIVWEYKTPLNGGLPVSQGTELGVNNNLTFQLNRYGVDFPGFDGVDLTPLGYIELNPDTLFCGVIDNITDIELSKLPLFPNPVANKLYFSGSDLLQESVTVEIHSLTGQLIRSEKTTLQIMNSLEVGDLSSGMYLVRIVSDSKVLALSKFTKL
jgi:hypothetical protein